MLPFGSYRSTSIFFRNFCLVLENFLCSSVLMIRFLILPSCWFFLLLAGTHCLHVPLLGLCLGRNRAIQGHRVYSEGFKHTLLFQRAPPNPWRCRNVLVHDMTPQDSVVSDFFSLLLSCCLLPASCRSHKVSRAVVFLI